MDRIQSSDLIFSKDQEEDVVVMADLDPKIIYGGHEHGRSSSYEDWLEQRCGGGKKRITETVVRRNLKRGINNEQQGRYSDYHALRSQFGSAISSRSASF